MSSETRELDPLEMLLDAARFIEIRKPEWAKAARAAVTRARAQPQAHGEAVAWQMREVSILGSTEWADIPERVFQSLQIAIDTGLKHLELRPLYAQPQADGEARQTRLAYDQGIADRFADRVRPTPTETVCDQVQADWIKYVPDIVKNAMLTMWNYICDDTKCHPLDIEHGKGKFLTFEPKHWAQFAGDMVAKNIADLIAQPEPSVCDQTGGKTRIFITCTQCKTPNACLLDELAGVAQVHCPRWDATPPTGSSPEKRVWCELCGASVLRSEMQGNCSHFDCPIGLVVTKFTGSSPVKQEEREWSTSVRSLFGLSR